MSDVSVNVTTYSPRVPRLNRGEAGRRAEFPARFVPRAAECTPKSALGGRGHSSRQCGCAVEVFQPTLSSVCKPVGFGFSPDEMGKIESAVTKAASKRRERHAFANIQRGPDCECKR